jgi:hypothetical protein
MKVSVTRVQTYRRNSAYDFAQRTTARAMERRKCDM